MKEINLTQGKVALVDDEDYERLCQYRWYARKAHNTYYARRAIYIGGKPFYIYMHREIIGTPPGMDSDHRNGDGLNNQRYNLRVCTHKQNLWNSRPYSNDTSSKFKGVHWCNTRKRWISKIYTNGKNKYIGGYLEENDAVVARDNMAKILCGEFARINL